MSEEDTMKQGTGSDPFTDGDSPDSETDNSSNDQQDKEASSDGGETATREVNSTEQLGGVADVDVEQVSVVDKVPHEDLDVPLRLIRENVKSSRDGNTLQVHMYEDTEQLVVDAEKAVQNSFNDKVSKMDINEALIIAALVNLDDVARVLEVWGYDQEIGL